MMMTRTKKIFSYVKVLSLAMIASTVLHAQTVEQGIRQMQYDRVNEAKNTFKQILEKEPSNTDALYYTGRIALLQGDEAQATDNFNKITVADKKNSLGIVGLGHVAINKGDSSSAFKNFDEALDRTDAKDLKVILAIADAFILSPSQNAKRPLDMLAKARNIKNLTSENKAAIYERIADIYFKQNNMSKAISSYDDAVYSDPKAYTAYLGKARIYVRAKTYQQAEEVLNEVIGLDSTFAPAYKELAEMYYTQDKYELSADMYKKYVNFSEPSFQSQLRYATIAYLAKRYDESLSILRKIESAEPNNLQVRHIIAFAYYSMDKPEEAIAEFDKYFAVAGEKEISATDYDYYGKMLLKSGQKEKAVEYLVKSVELDSSRVDSYGEVAKIYFENRDYNNAIKYFELKQQNSTKQMPLVELFQLGQAYYYQKEYVKSDSTFIQVTERTPDLLQGHLWRAIVNASIDTSSVQGLAKPHYEKVIEIGSKAPEKYKNNLIQAYSYLGFYYYQKQNDPEIKSIWEDKYIESWEKVLELDPTNQQAIGALKNTKKK